MGQPAKSALQPELAAGAVAEPLQSADPLPAAQGSRQPTAGSSGEAILSPAAASDPSLPEAELEALDPDQAQRTLATEQAAAVPVPDNLQPHSLPLSQATATRPDAGNLLELADKPASAQHQAGEVAEALVGQPVDPALPVEAITGVDADLDMPQADAEPAAEADGQLAPDKAAQPGGASAERAAEPMLLDAETAEPGAEETEAPSTRGGDESAKALAQPLDQGLHAGAAASSSLLAPVDSSRPSGKAGGRGKGQGPVDELLQALSEPDFINLAQHHHIMWVKLRGYPHWPVCG